MKGPPQLAAFKKKTPPVQGQAVPGLNPKNPDRNNCVSLGVKMQNQLAFPGALRQCMAVSETPLIEQAAAAAGSAFDCPLRSLLYIWAGTNYPLPRESFGCNDAS